MLRIAAVFGILGSFALVTASVVGAVGCSSSSSGGGGSGDQVNCPASGCTACTGPTGTAAPVSFSTTIQPILQIGCGTGGLTCHGQFGGGSAANLYLAEPVANGDGYGDAGAVYSGIVGVKSLEAPSLDIVDQNTPDDSYLMHKIDGDMCAVMSDCAPLSSLMLNATITQPCGVQMPQNSSPLTAEQRTEVWNWIAQGAKNN